MTNYLAKLKAQAEADAAARETAQRTEVEQQRRAWEHRLTPLVDRLSKLLEQIPPELRAQGLSLPELRKMLRGRRRGNVHPGELGAALRALKYSRVRRWNGSQGFNAVWRQHHVE